MGCDNPDNISNIIGLIKSYLPDSEKHQNIFLHYWLWKRQQELQSFLFVADLAKIVNECVVFILTDFLNCYGWQTITAANIAGYQEMPASWP